MKIPSDIIPILDSVVQSKLTPNDCPREIWHYNNHHVWVDIFLEFGIKLYNSGLDFLHFPKGYGLAAYIFDWEAQCQFDSWLAIDNRWDTLDKTIEAYKIVGLPREALAIKLAKESWRATQGNYDSVSSAYYSAKSEYPEDLDRLENVVCFFIDNAEKIFYINEKT
jgi:hypothetical protein